MPTEILEKPNDKHYEKEIAEIEKNIKHHEKSIVSLFKYNISFLRKKQKKR